MSAELSHATVLEGLLPRLKAEGYDVFVNPQTQMLPRFLGSYQPDVIALRDDRNLAIELAKPGRNADTRLRDIAALFEGQRDWEFRIIWFGADNLSEGLLKQSMSEISEKLDEIDRLLKGDHLDAAFLLSWAVLEALGRTLLEEKFRRPQTPGRLVEVLAFEGILSPSEADMARSLIERRNRLVHGELSVGVSRDDVQAIQSILRAILRSSVH